MDGQHLAFVEVHQDVLRAAIEPGNLAAGETLGKSLGQRKTQILAALLDVREAASPQHRLEARAHRFDFGQLRHDALNSRVALATCGLDAGQGCDLVVVGGVAGHADGAQERAGAVIDQDAAGHRDERAAHRVRHGGHELRLLLGACEQGARSKSHGKRAMRLADGDLGALQARAVLGGSRPQRTAGVEHDDGQRLEFVRPGAGECGGDYFLGDLELHGLLRGLFRAGRLVSLAPAQRERFPVVRRRSLH